MPAYVICTSPRCGSWLLAEALAETEVAGRPEEFFRPDWFARFKRQQDVEFQHRLHRDDPWPDGSPHDRKDEAADPPTDTDLAQFELFLTRILDLGRTPNGIFGMKAHRQQFSTAMARLRATSDRAGMTDVDILRSFLPDVKFIYLWREDELRRAISHYRAVVSDVWWATEETQETQEENSGFTLRTQGDLIEINRLARKVQEHNRQWRRMFDRAGIEPLEITYEQLAVDPDATVERVLEFLGLEHAKAPVRPRLLRQADGWTDAAVQTYITWARGWLGDPPPAQRAMR